MVLWLALRMIVAVFGAVCSAQIQITSISPTVGGLNGGVKVSINGQGFSANAPFTEQKNEAWFIDGRRLYRCDVTLVSSTPTVFLCTTIAMPAGTYNLTITVDGVQFSSANIKFKVSLRYTPQITSISPRSGTVGTLITVKGKIFTTRYGSNTKASSNGVREKLLRVYIGPQSCQMVNEEDGNTLYGLELDSEDSNEGTLICKANEANIGNHRFSFILDSPYGRSLADTSSYFLTRNGTAVNFQMHSDVSSVKPGTGSILGGTLLTVEGTSFADGATEVKVGGEDCFDISVLSSTKLNCRAPPMPTHEAGFIYQGSRGLKCEKFTRITSSVSNLCNVDLTNASPDSVETCRIDDSRYEDDSTDSYLVRISGCFVPSYSARYAFIIKGCGGACMTRKNADGQVEAVISSKDPSDPSASDTYNSAHPEDNQVSSEIYMVSGQPYCFEILHHHVDARSYVQLAVHTPDPPPGVDITAANTGMLRQTQHSMTFRKLIHPEIQELEFEDRSLGDGPSIPEIQTIIIMEAEAGQTYRLSLMGVTTVAIDSTALAVDLRKAIQNLPWFDKGDEVAVRTSGPVHSITFNSELGNLPLMEIVDKDGKFHAEIVRQQYGMSGGDTVVLDILGTVTRPLTRPLSAGDDQAILMSLGARCPTFLTNSASAIYSADFEDGRTGVTGGEIVCDVEAFCGRCSLKNPNFIYHVSPFRSKPLSDYQLCLAYQGDVGRQLNVTCVKGSFSKDYISERVTIDFGATQKGIWAYRCVQIKDILSIDSRCRSLNLKSLKLSSPVGDILVDVVTITSRATTTDNTERIWTQRIRPAMSEGKMVKSVSVEDITEAGADRHKSRVTMVMYDCGHNIPLITLYDSQGRRNDVTMSSLKKSSASYPIRTTATVGFKGKQADIPVNFDLDENQVAFNLESINEKEIGSLNVTKDGNCSHFSWVYTFISKNGNQDLFQVTMGSDQGDVTGTVVSLKNGSTFYDPIPGDLLYTSHLTPQVQVTVNSIPASCSGNCQFEWASSSTPAVIDASPSSGLSNREDVLAKLSRAGEDRANMKTLERSMSHDVLKPGRKRTKSKDNRGLRRHIDQAEGQTALPGIHNTRLTITGTNFSSTPAENMVTIGNVDCPIDCSDRCSDVRLVCTVPNCPEGTHKVTVTTDDKGTASSAKPITFTCEFGITSLSPVTGSEAGGTLLTFTGYGISPHVSVKVADEPCVIDSTLENVNTEFTCWTPPLSGDDPSSEVTVTNLPGGPVTVLTLPFVYTAGPTITTLTIPDGLSTVLGGQTIAIAGTDLQSDVNPCTTLVLVKQDETWPAAEVDVTVVSPTQLTTVLPGLEAGVYDIYIRCAHGNTKNENNLQINYDFSVLAIRPLVSSAFGGARFTVKGTGFGDDPSILSATIGPHVCHIDPETFSATQLMCLLERTGREHHITNNGTSAKHGSNCAWSRSVMEVTKGDRVTWTWRTDVDTETMGVYQTKYNPHTGAEEEHEEGFSSGDPRTSGSFSTEFGVPGVYKYWSRYIDAEEGSTGTIALRGQVRVNEVQDSHHTFTLTMGDDHKYTAVHDVRSGVTFDPGTCEMTIPESCDLPTSTSDKFSVSFLKCLSGVTMSVSPLRGSDVDNVVFETNSLADKTCHMEITLGTKPCVVSSVRNGVTCRVDPGNDIPVGIDLPITVRTNNFGYSVLAITNPASKAFTFCPRVDSVTPLVGSVAGDTGITVTGTGLSKVTVKVGGDDCVISDESFRTLTCQTPPMSEQSGKNGNSLRGIDFYHAGCDVQTPTVFPFRYKSVVILASISTSEVSGPTTIYFEGYGFGTDIDQVSVSIGHEKCTVSSVTDDKIICNVKCLSAETHMVKVNVGALGSAAESEKFTVTGRTAVISVDPKAGSENGGLTITISGNGFPEDGMSVTVGGIDCPIVGPVTTCGLVCEIPSPNQGQEDINLFLEQTQISGPALSFHYDSSLSPLIYSVTPSTGTAEIDITINGDFLGTVSSVTVGGTDCVISQDNPGNENQVTCILGVHAAGETDVVVMVPGYGRSLVEDDTPRFTYELVVDSISPTAGPQSGGQYVTVAGEGFDCQTTTVTFGGQDCVTDEAKSSATTVVCSTPASDFGSGTVDVVVLQDSLTETLLEAYTYEDGLSVPCIDGISPNWGGTAGGTLITITGSNFGDDPDKVKVTAADLTCVVLSVDTETIICETEASGQTKTGRMVVLINSKVVGMSDGVLDTFHYIDKYSSPHTWGNASPPGDGDLVVVSERQVLMIDQDKVPKLAMLLIDGGKVMFERVMEKIELNAEYILIINGGTLEIGTEEEPYVNEVIIRLHGNPLSTELPVYGAKCIALREGTLDLHGNPQPVAWTLLAETVAAGSKVLKLRNAVEWEVGNNIVIATTGHRQSQGETETGTIESVSEDKTTLTLTNALVYNHDGFTETHAGHDFEIRAEVGLLSHNIKIIGNQDPPTKHVKACDAGFDTGEFAIQTCSQGRFGDDATMDKYGAHIIIHSPEPEKDLVKARIENVELYRVGQAFHLGRYPINFHLLGDMTSYYLRGCSIWRSFNRAVNIHGTHNLLVEHNVIYDVKGGAFFLEDGIETGNIIQYNLGLFVIASSGLLNEDITPAVFWVTNPDNIIRHNHAAGGTHFGFWYRLHDRVDGLSFTPDVTPINVPLGIFYNNTAHSVGSYGLWVFAEYYPKHEGDPHGVPVTAKFETLTAWNCEKGAEFVNAGALQLCNSYLINNEKAGFEGQLTLNAHGTIFEETGYMVSSSVIVGYSENLPPHPLWVQSDGSLEINVKGIVLPYGKGIQVKDTAFVNFDADGAYAFTFAVMDGTCLHRCGGWNYRVSLLVFFNADQRTLFLWLHNGVIEDMDGTLTGTGQPKKILPYMDTLPSDSCVGKTSPMFNNGEMTIGFCDSTVKFHRFAFTGISPDVLSHEDVLLTNLWGTVPGHREPKRGKQRPGWVVTVPEIDGSYLVEFEYAKHVANMSYTGVFYDFDQDTENSVNYLIMCHIMEEEPDQFYFDGETSTEKKDGVLTSSDADGTWSWDPIISQLCYIVSSNRETDVAWSALVYEDDRPMNMVTYKCKYDGCIVPDPLEIPPRCEPDDDIKITWTQFCSELTTAEKCGEGANVTIPSGMWVAMESTTTDILNSLTVRGTLKALRDATIVLNAKYVLIIGGHLIIGCATENFVGMATIQLFGDRDTPAWMPYGSAAPLGAKAIGVFGELSLNGTGPETPWTLLQVTAAAGDTTISLGEEVGDWYPGDQIVVTATGYNPNEDEVRTIQDIWTGGGVSQITVDVPLDYHHVVGTETFDDKSYTIAAEVGLLTRNIKIQGALGKNDPQSFGARVVVATWEEPDPPHDVYRGFAHLRNVEFYGMGQEGYTERNDPRYSLVFMDLGDSSVTAYCSVVVGCVFHHNYNTAVGIYGTSNLLVENSTIYHTVGPSLITDSANTTLRYNLLSLMLWRGSYNGRNDNDLEYYGSITAYTVTDLVLIGNHISSSERICLHAFPQSYDDTSLARWQNNVVHTCLIGVGLLPEDKGQPDLDSDGGVVYTGITVYKCWDFGIYYNGVASVTFDGITLVDNGVGLYTHVYKPNPLTHEMATKFVTISNGLVVLRSATFDCHRDIIDTTTHNYRKSDDVGRSYRINGKGVVGITTSSFMGGSNASPSSPLLFINTYNALAGRTNVRGTTFATDPSRCADWDDRAISTNPANDDCIHPTYMKELKFSPGFPEKKKYNNHRPRLGTINPSDCVDMDCDGQKKAIIVDEDGTLIGTPGTVLSESEWEWNGDARRGLGDYRLPASVFLGDEQLETDVLAAERGIVRDDECMFNDDWQAHVCTRYEYAMMMIESMDSDTEMRRLSPVALVANPGPDGYVDLINGPQDHGWCFGSTCQKRISTFPAIVGMGLFYKLFFSSTPPQDLRLLILHTDKKILMAIYYFNPNRLDVFCDEEYVKPTNSYYKDDILKDDLRYRLDANKDSYIPTVNDACGTNFYDNDAKLLYVVVCGEYTTEIKISPAVIVDVSLPAMSIEDSEKVLNDLALFLNVPANKIKFRDVTRARSSRQKRSAGSSTDYIIQIANDACNNTYCATSVMTLSAADLATVANAIINAYLTGLINSILNVFVNNIQVSEALPATTDSTWMTIVNAGDVTAVLKVPEVLLFKTAIIEASEGNVFTQQPILHFVDKMGGHVTILGIATMSWQVTATLRQGTGGSSNCTVTLMGTTTISFVDGWANFIDLAISCSGVGYMIDFDITSPLATNFTLVSGNLTILPRPLFATIKSVTTNLYTSEMFEVVVHLKDRETDTVITDITWKGHSWTAVVSIANDYGYSGMLSGTTTVPFNAITGEATISGLTLNKAGILKLAILVTSSPAEYRFSLQHEMTFQWIAMKTTVAQQRSVVVKYDLPYNVYGSTAFAKAACNDLVVKNTGVSLSNCTASSGSIMVMFTLDGTNATIDEFLGMVCHNITSTLVFDYNGTDAVMEQYVLVDGIQPTFCSLTTVETPRLAGQDDSSAVLAIVLAALIGSILLVSIAIVFLFIKNKAEKRRLRVTKVGEAIIIEEEEDEEEDEDVEEEEIEMVPPGPPGTIEFPPGDFPPGSLDPPDQLFRQDTFMAFQDYFPEKAMPPSFISFRERPKTPKKFKFNFE